MPSVTTQSSTLAKSSTDSLPHSTTNVQVLGIDEPDMVKNDGKYLYMVDEYSDSVVILDAHTMQSVSKISLPQDYHNTKILREKNFLVVTAQKNISTGAGY